MPDEIMGVMAVKNGQKQTIMNLSNARQKSYADLQTMTDAQKKGVIICPDYPKGQYLVQANQVGYGSGTVEDALDELTDYKLLFNGNPTTANTFEEFNLNDSLANYRFLIFLYMAYYNTTLSYVEPKALFDIQTNTASRVQIYDNGSVVAEIYKVSDTRIALKQTNVSGALKVRIYGFN
jgi:hypothetical protein